MAESPRSDVTELNEEPRRASSDSGENGDGVSYDALFPDLPTCDKMAADVVKSAVPKTLYSSTVNHVFTILVQDRRREKNEKSGIEVSKRICANISKSTGADIEICVSKTADLTFSLRGKQGAVTQAKQNIKENFEAKEYRTYVFGKNGLPRSDIEQRNNVLIKMTGILAINVNGTKGAVAKAVEEVQLFLDDLISKNAVEKIEIPQFFHCHITGPNYRFVNRLMKETGVKIVVPPWSVHSDKVTVFGDKNGVRLAVDKIRQIYEEKKREANNTKVMEIKKKDVDAPAEDVVQNGIIDSEVKSTFHELFIREKEIHVEESDNLAEITPVAKEYIINNGAPWQRPGASMITNVVPETKSFAKICKPKEV